MNVDFSDFNPQSKEEWATAASKALKGKPIEGLQWSIDEEITLDPIYTADEAADGNDGIELEKGNNDWWIGEEFDGDRPAFSNGLLLQALNGGLNSPRIVDVEDFRTCLNEVRVDFLFPVFKGSNIQSYLEWLKELSFDQSTLEGAFIICESAEDLMSSELTKSLTEFAEALPNYYHSAVWMELNGDPISDGMVEGLIAISDLIYAFKENRIPVRILCEVECSNNFIKSISSIRALRLLLAQICMVYEISQDSILIDAHIFQTAADTQLSIIGASAQATAAVTAGVDRLTIQCEGSQAQEEEVTRRMTRNIHHLMKMESGLHEVIDPAAGSYTIEKLTSEIAERTWKKFQSASKRS